MTTTQLSEHGKAVIELHRDGEWHSRNEVIAAAIRRIDAGVAHRQGLLAWEGDRRRKGTVLQRPADAILVHRGALTMARSTIRGAIRRGSLEVDSSERTRLAASAE